MLKEEQREREWREVEEEEEEEGEWSVREVSIWLDWRIWLLEQECESICSQFLAEGGGENIRILAMSVKNAYTNTCYL